MDRYRWSPINLMKELSSFVGGQCGVETRTSEIYRGKIRSFSNPKGRKIIITLEWLCVMRVVFDEYDVPRDRWFLIPAPPSGFHFFDFDYITYYPQEDEGRIKLKGWKGEVCHLYGKEDHTNLVGIDGEFIPYCRTREKYFKLIVLALLKKQMK
ncbi:MAG: hypothetical protein Q8Q03_00355 [bacterium]|nr:hypothetical protein [bacterium]